MYSVYINERLLKICQDKETLSGSDLVFRLSGDEPVSFIKELVYSFEKQPQLLNMTIATLNIDKTWETFIQSYTLIEAAGGLVFNDENLLLMIFRKNKWDLPKGKIEPGEQPDEAALREVIEECGLQQLTLKKQIATTYHTYLLKKERILKRTYWFKMTSNDTELLPQADEGITEVCWKSRTEIKNLISNTYAGIAGLLVQQDLT